MTSTLVPRRRRAAPLAGALLLALSGCATVFMTTDDGLSPYNGARGWIKALDKPRGWEWALVIPFMIIDLPLSFVADTALLPVSVPYVLLADDPPPSWQPHWEPPPPPGVPDPDQ